jgi:hypothetical protein
MVVMPVSFMLGARAMPAGQIMGIFWIAPALVVASMYIESRNREAR